MCLNRTKDGFCPAATASSVHNISFLLLHMYLKARLNVDNNKDDILLKNRNAKVCVGRRFCN